MGAGTDGARRMRIAIIGAGPGGLCMAKRLLDAGFEDFVLLEKSDAVGGTWNHNRYPGCACDVPSNLYSFSFAVKRDWSRPYAPQPEILAYMQEVAERFGVLPHCRFGVEVARAEWDDEASEWTLSLDSGATVQADVVVSAIGMFNDLAWPDIPGVADFRGTTFHSAQWNWNHDLRGERVAVVGSAASAVQFVPEIAPQVGRLHLFQRTANWVLPKLDDPYTPEQIAQFLADPSIIDAARDELHRSMDQGMTFSDMAANAEREKLGLAMIDIVEDPHTREQLRPDHPWGCKRPLFSNHWYPTFNRPDVELVTDRIECITHDAVVTADGTRREVDTLILATGFSATKYLSAIDVVGRGGRHIDDAWNDGAQAYLGITTSGFPNLFMLYGPNTNNGSILTMIEYQVEHVLSQVCRLVDEALAWVDVRPEPQAAFNAEVQRAIAGVTVWQGGCNGYYRAPGGRVVTQWPFSMTEFRNRTAQLDPDAFEVGARG